MEMTKLGKISKWRIDNQTLFAYFQSKQMTEPEVCALLEDMGVILDRKTWQHVVDVFDGFKKPEPYLERIDEIKEQIKKL